MIRSSGSSSRREVYRKFLEVRKSYSGRNALHGCATARGCARGEAFAPRPNRVTPFGSLIAVPTRGELTDDRGILHDAQGRIGTRRWAHPHWVACRPSYKDRRRPIMAPGAYTELFFLDEATALSAGHRPCAACRSGDVRRFAAAWATVHPGSVPSASAIDRRLHAVRIRRDRSQMAFETEPGGPPAATMVALDEAAWLATGAALRPWQPEGYGTARPLPEGPVRVLNPRIDRRVVADGLPRDAP